MAFTALYYWQVIIANLYFLLQFKTLSYPTLAFEFEYPVTTASGRKLPVIISRKPERYSSAAPMTADARQRIVTELVDFPDGITISVSVRSAQVSGLHEPPCALHYSASITERGQWHGLAHGHLRTTTGKLLVVPARDMRHLHLSVLVLLHLLLCDR